MKTLVADDSSTSVGRQVLTLAGDALCLAATALRLATLPTPTVTSTPTESTDPETCNACPRDDLPEYPLSEVAWHDNASDCWVVIYDLVYDVTNFLREHPGGEDVLLEYAGRDASVAFRSVNHGPAAHKALEKYLVGYLPFHQRIYRPRTSLFNKKEC